MKKIIMTMMLILLVFFAGCAQSIKDVKTEENIGKVVAVRGTVENTVKIGDLSGYTLRDENGDTIGVVSKALPAEGDTVTAKGELVKAPILGYYINVDK